MCSSDLGALTGTGTASLSGTVAIGAASTIGGAGTLTLSGVVSGTALTKAGAGTLNLSGANTYTGLTTVSAGTLSAQNATALHWLGHSLGGLVILRMLECAPDLPPGRIVLAGTPSRGSYAARELSKHQLGEMAIGRSLAEWLAREDHGTFPGREIGVIAGSNGFGLGMFVAPELPEPNDGAGAVEETKLPAACDHIVRPVSHSGMLISHALANQTAAFWRNGRFTRETAAA